MTGRESLRLYCGTPFRLVFMLSREVPRSDFIISPKCNPRVPNDREAFSTFAVHNDSRTKNPSWITAVLRPCLITPRCCWIRLLLLLPFHYCRPSTTGLLTLSASSLSLAVRRPPLAASPQAASAEEHCYVFILFMNKFGRILFRVNAK